MPSLHNVQGHLPNAALVFKHAHIVALTRQAIHGKRYRLLPGRKKRGAEQQPTVVVALEQKERASQALCRKEKEGRELWKDASRTAATCDPNGWSHEAMAMPPCPSAVPHPQNSLLCPSTFLAPHFRINSRSYRTLRLHPFPTTRWWSLAGSNR